MFFNKLTLFWTNISIMHAIILPKTEGVMHSAYLQSLINDATIDTSEVGIMSRGLKKRLRNLEYAKVLYSFVNSFELYF